MIGIVLVSHSATLAEGVRELAMQMANERVALVAAGGVGNPDSPIGTDPMRVLAAIEQVYSDEGVLVLMDLGSALMSAETALDFLPPEQRQHVYLCAAPLVEGAVAATARAMAGGSLVEVLAEANAALDMKRVQLSPTQQLLPPLGYWRDESSPASQSASGGVLQQITIIVPNRLGLHARPAARLVELAGNFLAQVTVHKAAQQASLNSINQLLMLGAREGETLTFSATGQEAKDALAAIQLLVAENFGDKDEALADSAPALSTPLVTPTSTHGISASPGIAIGPALLMQPAPPPLVAHQVSDLPAEWWRLQDALAAALIELDTLRNETHSRADESTGGIFAAQRAMLQDQLLQDAAHDILHSARINAEVAWQQAVDQLAARYRNHAVAHLRDRAADVVDVGQRVLRHLTGTHWQTQHFDQPGILVTRELSPSEAAQLPREKVLGIITEAGGATSHTAILARSLGIPAVVGCGSLLQHVQPGQVIGMDGAQGHIWLQPDEHQRQQLLQQRQQWLAQQGAAGGAAQQPATLRDGKRIVIAANLVSPDEAPQVLALGAEGVGLFRSEFLYMGRNSPPSEDEHYAAYVTVAQALGKLPLIVRTLDIGGDKPIPYLGLTAEVNPFLGWRGIRFCLDRPDLFKPQLRALLRASVDYNIQIMFPMVSTITEVQQARQLLAAVQAELQATGLPTGERTPVGIMVETPAAVLMADHLAHEVDFFSIGTNDLTQYTLAADRSNTRVAGLVNSLQPAVLHSIHQVVQAAHRAGIWAGVCGEIASNPAVAALLVGLGVDELSMTPSAIPTVKAHLRDRTANQTAQLAEQALALATTVEIEQLLH